MQEDNTLEEKQAFLRENILNKGYNKEKFTSYMKDLRGIVV